MADSIAWSGSARDPKALRFKQLAEKKRPAERHHLRNRVGRTGRVVGKHQLRHRARRSRLPARRKRSIDRTVCRVKNSAIGAHYSNARGEIFFGGANGFNAFNPATLQVNALPPRIALTSLFARESGACHRRRRAQHFPDCISPIAKTRSPSSSPRWTSPRPPRTASSTGSKAQSAGGWMRARAGRSPTQPAWRQLHTACQSGKRRHRVEQRRHFHRPRGRSAALEVHLGIPTYAALAPARRLRSVDADPLSSRAGSASTRAARTSSFANARASSPRTLRRWSWRTAVSKRPASPTRSPDSAIAARSNTPPRR